MQREIIDGVRIIYSEDNKFNLVDRFKADSSYGRSPKMVEGDLEDYPVRYEFSKRIPMYAEGVSSQVAVVVKNKDNWGLFKGWFLDFQDWAENRDLYKTPVFDPCSMPDNLKADSCTLEGFLDTFGTGASHVFVFGVCDWDFERQETALKKRDDILEIISDQIPNLSRVNLVTRWNTWDIEIDVLVVPKGNAIYVCTSQAT